MSGLPDPYAVVFILKDAGTPAVIQKAGFRKGYSTIDHTVKQPIEKTLEYNMPLVLCFVNYNKFFDSIETATVITSINQKSISPMHSNTP